MEYCLFVNKLKPECIEAYSNYHEEAHNTRWKSQIYAIRNAGFGVCDVYVYNDLSIVVIGSDDLDASFKTLNTDEDNQKWQTLMAGFFAASPKFDGKETETAKKVFDLNAQYDLISD